MNKDLKIAVKAAVHGGSDIMEIYVKEDLGVEYKDDESPLTLADKKCNDIINSYLIKTEFPLSVKRIDSWIIQKGKIGILAGSWILWMVPRNL